ncbi:unnamed protein product [Soboliphyme baturini]|uniref:Sigma non-opioid intracellular receptor 1 n=1 Tax=Soboliphyme baturini TaxID=241478 RepID=A0A183J483_9BILA|nr:unnamed protein product [Soboliphyme baturini]
MARWLIKVFRYIVLLSVLCTLVQYYLARKAYIFSPRHIKSVGEKLAGQPPSNCLEGIYSELKRSYPSHLIPVSSKGFVDYLSSLTPEEVTYKRSVHRPTWFAFNVGGLSGKIHLLHVSTTEYIAILGTPFRSSGASGIHWMNQSCTVLSGSMQRLTDSSGLRKEEFLPGSHARFASLENALVELTDDTWLLCYGRGKRKCEKSSLRTDQ